MRTFGYVMLTLAVVLAVCMSVSPVYADSPPARGKIWSPLPSEPAPAVDSWKAHNWYAGLVGAHTWNANEADNDNSWQLGGVGGYLYRTGPTGLAGGVEADYSFRDLQDTHQANDGFLTLRGRLGTFISPKTFLYGTAGMKWDVDEKPRHDSNGPVVGAGVDYYATQNFVLRAEVLHYRESGALTSWGDDGSTAVRLGALWSF